MAAVSHITQYNGVTEFLKCDLATPHLCKHIFKQTSVSNNTDFTRGLLRKSLLKCMLVCSWKKIQQQLWRSDHKWECIACKNKMSFHLAK